MNDQYIDESSIVVIRNLTITLSNMLWTQDCKLGPRLIITLSKRTFFQQHL